VLARTPKVSATPRDGVVAAKAASGPIKPNAKMTVNVTAEILLNFLIYLFSIIDPLDRLFLTALLMTI
jgi:hypothetical protein